MELTFAQDFTSNVVLDTELKNTPSSGLYWNNGVHPLVTVENILDVSPNLTLTFNDWGSGVTYAKYENSKDFQDLVVYDTIIYQSLSTSNTNNQPDISPNDWLVTNIESLRIKALIEKSKQNMIAATKLQRSFIENQYIYHIGESDVTPPNDYSGWTFEPKGSDYVSIRINQISFCANTATPQSLYVINQGVLIDTLTLNPVNGNLSFEDVNYTISGKGAFHFVVDSQSVKGGDAYNDPLKYNGFVCYPITGIGDTAEDAVYTYTGISNGLNFNVSAFVDSTKYISNNLIDFARLWQLQFAMDVLKTMIYNPNVRSNNAQRNASSNLLQVEALDLNSNTTAQEYTSELKRVKEAINRTFDRFLRSPKKFKVNYRTV